MLRAESRLPEQIASAVARELRGPQAAASRASAMPRTVVHFTDATDFGGAERMLLTVLAGLDRQRWRPVLLHRDHPGIAPLVREAQALGVNTRALPPWRRRNFPRWLLDRARELRAEDAQVFHAHLVWGRRCRDGLAAAIAARVPAIVATQQLFAPIRSARALWAQKLLFLGVDRYLAVSTEMSAALAGTCLFPARKIRVVYNAVPLASFGRPPDSRLRASLTGGTDRPVVLTLARLDPQKGLEYLVDAAAKVPDAVFAIAGDGPLRQSLEARATRLGIADRVRLLGYRQDVPDLLATADLFVLPSLFEGLPVSVLEAMAAGKAVIASAVAGTDEAVVHGETGILVAPRDPVALAGAVRELLDERVRRERFGAAGAERATREFSAETLIARITAIYEDVLAGSRKVLASA